MKYLTLPANTGQQLLPFYLAMEEWAARSMPAGKQDLFFMWQVDPTVIFGRNQLIYSEVNLSYCREHGINVFRRKSGGGCVYADRSNIMMSYITSADSVVTTTFSRYTHAVASMLRSLGLNAVAGGRNDVLIDGLKVSGNSFYHLPGASIVHGTMLFDTDMDNMLHAITPSTQKLESKGVESVRKHITTLSEHLGGRMNIEQFKAYVRKHLCQGELVLSESAVQQIKQIETGYLTHDFIYGRNPRCNWTRDKRIEGVGEFHISMEIDHNLIKSVDVAGDYFLLGDLDEGLIKPLIGADFSPEGIRQALQGTDVGKIVMNFSTDQLINLLFE